MEITLLREILELKTATNIAHGMTYPQALHAAQAELVGQAGKALYGVDFFCFRARLTGAARTLASTGAGRHLERSS